MKVLSIEIKVPLFVGAASVIVSVRKGVLMEMVAVFPAPLGPGKAKNLPLSTVKLILFTEGDFASLYCFTSCLLQLQA
jgi:hypothetical protein